MLVIWAWMWSKYKSETKWNSLNGNTVMVKSINELNACEIFASSNNPMTIEVKALLITESNLNNGIKISNN